MGDVNDSAPGPRIPTPSDIASPKFWSIDEIRRWRQRTGELGTGGTWEPSHSDHFVEADYKIIEDDDDPTSAPVEQSPLRWYFLNMKDALTQLQVEVWTFGRRSRVRPPPGHSLLWFADFFYSRKSVEEYLRPTIQDLQDEYAEALAATRPHKARWVRIRGTWSFLCAASLLTVASIGKQVVKIWKAVA